MVSQSEPHVHCFIMKRKPYFTSDNVCKWYICDSFFFSLSLSPRLDCCTLQSLYTGCYTWWCPGSAGWTSCYSGPCTTCTASPSPSAPQWRHTTAAGPWSSSFLCLLVHIWSKNKHFERFGYFKHNFNYLNVYYNFVYNLKTFQSLYHKKFFDKRNTCNRKLNR